jgi:hypothetical protein
MARRDQLTYDLGQRSRSQVPWKPALLLAAVIAVAGLLLAWAVVGSRSPQAVPATGPAAASPTASPTGGSTAPTASALPSGSDAQEGLGVPEGSQQAASLFVRAWLDRSAKTRKPALEQVATPALAEQLMLTDPANIPRARPRGAPVLGDASTYSTQFTQTLSTGMKIQVYLVADPEARYRWLATSVAQA